MYICRVALFYFIPEIQRIRSEQVKTDNSFKQLFHLTFKLYVSCFWFFFISKRTFSNQLKIKKNIAMHCFNVLRIE